MRFTASEKQEIIHMVVKSEIGVKKTLFEIGLIKARSTTGIKFILTWALMV